MAGARKKPNRTSGKYQGYYLDHAGKRVFFIGTTSRKETISIAKSLEDKARRILLGYEPEPTTPMKHRKRPFLEVVEEYLAWGRAFGRADGKPWAPGYAKRKEDHLRKWAETLSFEVLADLEDILSRVEAVLGQMAEAGSAGSTIAYRAISLSSFCQWCVGHGYLVANPLANLPAIDVAPQTERRALTADEIARLFAVAPAWCRLAYAVALTAGLRLSELRKLDRTDLEIENSRLRLRWKVTKNKKPAYCYLPVQLAAAVAAFADSGLPKQMYEKAHSQLVLPESPLLFIPKHMLRRLDHDLERAKIPKVTHEGKIDFHALRASFVTFGSEVGATPKELQSMARHADPKLTFNIYAKKRDPRMAELAERIGAVLPAVESAIGVHSGEDGGGQVDANCLSGQALLLAPKEVGLRGMVAAPG